MMQEFDFSEYQKQAQEREAKEKASSLNLPYLNLLGYPIDPEALELVEKGEAQRSGLIPIQRDDPKLVIACLDPERKETKELIQKLEDKGYKIKLVIISPHSLEYGLGFYQFIHKPSKKVIGLLEINKKALEKIEKEGKIDFLALKREIENFRDFRIEKILEIIFGTGIILGASDIHLEPKEEKAILRYRLDGLLHQIAYIKPEIFKKIITRIKLISAMKLNIRDVPQDGRFTIRFERLEIEIRSSIVPSEYGEMAVLRILDPRSINLKISDLGFREDQLKIIEEQLQKPNGLILNTGPTGSGKTTTLYTFLRHKQSPEIKIITIEDPIEYRLEGIDQTQVNENSGYTFANGLRSLLRHDPDIILVGEIRDKETAEIAMHASLTGHLVFSTLHTNDAIGAVPRLIDMGIVPSILASALNMSIAQRLVRKLCSECKEAYSPPKEFLKNLEKAIKKAKGEIKIPELKNLKIYKAKKCPECPFGYKGRIGIFELFVVDKEIENLIAKSPTHAQLLELATKKGMLTMKEDAIIKIALGITSIEEAERVLGKLF